MKKTLINFICVVMLITTLAISSQAQNSSYSKGISMRALFLDYQSQNDGDITAFKTYSHGFEFAYHHRINDNVKFVIPFNVGQVQSHSNVEGFMKTIYGGGVQVQYEFGKLESNIIPYIVGGVDAVTEQEGEFNLQAPLGFGLNFKMNERAYWFWQSDYRFSFSDDRNNLHHGLGFVYLWGGKPKAEIPIENTENDRETLDSDGDGIPNDLDLCPNASGPKRLNGCPDSDGDGIADYEDDCPKTRGLASMNGCPDSDGDGVSDNDDECPNMAGTIANNGCPDNDRDGDGIPDALDRCPDIPGSAAGKGCPTMDRDNDGVIDSKDKCPDQAGSVATNGCPDKDGDGVPDADDKCPDAAGLSIYNGCPDSDGDGIDDSRDRCPFVAGSVATNGCPEIKKEDRRVLELAMRAVQFDTGKTTLKSESYSVLKKISNILKKYPNYKLSINGHTDSVGSAAANQRLSEKRAESCYKYLLSLGNAPSRISFAGYGESKPISDNNSLRGRALNRRTEFTLTPM